ncbi:epimerase [Nioella aestuarii]|uniref:epimerase n=1 Tax=Nioella aestuarii TaxID=1662864 RepID=UPI003D7FDE34
MTQTALILGATGRLGRHAAEAFSNAGWAVRQFDRRKDDLMQAARGADVIVNGWNPPYSQWQASVPDLTRQVIAAAKDSGATVIIPGNVYVYGPDMPPVIGPGVAHLAEHPLGRIRRNLEDAYRDAGVPTIILRAGDFLDEAASGNWFDLVLAKPIAKGRLTYPGALDLPHAWAWLPDVAAAMVGLAKNRATLPRFADLAFPGYTLTGEELAAACGAALHRPVVAKRMNWLPIHLARPFWREAKHLLEMRYLWETPHQLDGTALDAVLPDRQRTPLTSVLARALQHQIDPDKTVTRRAVAV